MKVVTIILLLACLTASGCISLEGGHLVLPEDVLIYQPAGPHPDDWEPPGLTYEDVNFMTPDEVSLHGWYCPVDKPKAYVLFCHGNAANISYRYPDFVRLTKRHHVSVFAFDYRGYGRSEGKPSEKGLMIDARAARDWFAEKEGIEPEQIVLYGRSLGGGVAVDLASKDGAKGLILESTFTSLPAVANDLLPLWPGTLMVNRYSSLKKISDYQGPLLIAHGKEDQLIPYEHGQKLFEAANDPKRFIPIDGAGHNWLPPEGYQKTLDEFFAGL